MLAEMQQLNTWEGYVDWRNKPAMKARHGGLLAASFVLVVEVLENLAYLANASNLVLYLTKFMHFSPSSSANIVTNFMGTAFLLALLGGFLADAFFTTYCIYLISATIEFMVQSTLCHRQRAPSMLNIQSHHPTMPDTNMHAGGVLLLLYKPTLSRDKGLLILTIQAHTPSLKPTFCTFAHGNTPCEQLHGGKAVLLFAGLYLIALGVGGIKGSLPPHGAEQFDEKTPKGRKQRSSFFNYFVFSLSCGALIAVSFVVWVEDNKGWQWGFGIATATILLSIPIFLLGSPTYRTKIPAGSPITTIFKVLAAAIYNRCVSRNSSNVIASMKSRASSYPTDTSEEEGHAKENTQIQTATQELKFLDGAVMRNPIHPALACSEKQVEEVKIVIKVLPIFMSTIMLNCCLAQLSTFSVQQAASMNTKIGSLRVPPASLPIFPVLFMMVLAPVYSHIIVPFSRKVTKTEMGVTHLQRIGIGLVLSIAAMAVAALVEAKRKRVAVQSNMLNSSKPLPITFLWIALQYLFLGSADLFSLAGMMDFFFTEAPFSMRSLATAMSWASLAMGYYLSSVLVSIVNSITGTLQNTPWLTGSNLNHYQLNRFYWLLCVLSGLNYLLYMLWTSRYKYRSIRPQDQRENPNINSLEV